jgi:hypothetical protein
VALDVIYAASYTLGEELRELEHKIIVLNLNPCICFAFSTGLPAKGQLSKKISTNECLAHNMQSFIGFLGRNDFFGAQFINPMGKLCQKMILERIF